MPDKKSASLRLRLTPAEKEVFERAAEVEGIDVSVLIRGAARKEAVRILMEAGEQNPFRPATSKKARPKRAE